MKSAYELAMERLSKVEPSKTLNAAQKERIADLESLYKSRLAQAELATNEEIEAAEAAKEFEQAFSLRERLQAERKKLQAELEEKKDAVRNSR
jgi:hypothetical protein